MIVEIWLFVIGIIETAAVCTVAWLAFTGFFRPMRPVAVLGIWLITAGLIVQIMRTLYYFDTGFYPADHYFPLWIFKDMGGSALIFDLAFLSWQQHQQGHTP